MITNSVRVTVNDGEQNEQIAYIERSPYSDPITAEELEYSIYNKIFSIANPNPKFPGDSDPISADAINDYCKKSFTIEIISNNGYPLSDKCAEHTIIVNDPNDTAANVKIIYSANDRDLKDGLPHCYSDTMSMMNPLITALNIACLLVNDKHETVRDIRHVPAVITCRTGMYICTISHTAPGTWEKTYDLSDGDIILTTMKNVHVLRIETGDADINEWACKGISNICKKNIPDMIKAGIIKPVPLGMDSILLRAINGFVAAKTACGSVKPILFPSENDMTNESRNAICNICDSIDMNSFYAARDALREAMDKSFGMLIDITEKISAFLNTPDDERGDN